MENRRPQNSRSPASMLSLDVGPRPSTRRSRADSLVTLWGTAGVFASELEGDDFADGWGATSHACCLCPEDGPGPSVRSAPTSAPRTSPRKVNATMMAKTMPLSSEVSCGVSARVSFVRRAFESARRATPQIPIGRRSCSFRSRCHKPFGLNSGQEAVIRSQEGHRARAFPSVPCVCPVPAGSLRHDALHGVAGPVVAATS